MLETSPSTDKLDAALAKVQGELSTASKDKTNPHFQKTYADISSVWAAAREPLSKHGVSVTQWPIHSTDGRVHLITRVAHAGEWLKATFSVRADKDTAQGYGSAVTYLKRYGLSAAIGVVSDDEDDDGNGAEGDGKKKGNQRPQSEGPKPAAPASAWKPTKANLKTLQDTATKSGWANEQVTAYILNRFKKKLLELTQLEADTLIDILATKKPSDIAPAFLSGASPVVKDQPRQEAAGTFDQVDDPSQVAGYVK